MELTQHKSQQQWVVVVGKREFVLTDEQLSILKAADLAGQRGIVWFGDFAISIPHIDVIYSENRSGKAETRNLEEVEINGKIVYRDRS